MSKWGAERSSGPQSPTSPRLILFGENSLRSAARGSVVHYHTERNQQGLQNRIIDRRFSDCDVTGPIKRRQRMGGLLNYYYRAAA
jgi:putative transposase